MTKYHYYHSSHALSKRNINKSIKINKQNKALLVLNFVKIAKIQAINSKNT